MYVKPLISLSNFNMEVNENPKMYNISITDNHRAKMMKFWNLGYYGVYIVGTFRVKLVEVSLGHSVQTNLLC